MGNQIAEALRKAAEDFERDPPKPAAGRYAGDGVWPQIIAERLRDQAERTEREAGDKGNG